MTKRKRTAHIPQGAPRKRRPARRAFDTATTTQTAEPEVEVSEPVFADTPVADIPGFGGSVVGTRRTGRRLEQLRRSSGASEAIAASRAATGQLPTYDRSYLVSELRRIAIISTGLLAVIIALSFILR